VEICETVAAPVWKASVNKDILLLSLSQRVIASQSLERGPTVWDWDTLGAWKQGTLIAQGVLGSPATVSGREMALRGDQEEGEDLTCSCREIEAAENSSSKGYSDWRPHTHQPGGSSIVRGSGGNKALSLWMA
jgi:hypothetical protein